MKRIHYSWVILSITFLAIIVAGIGVASSGVFITPFELEFGWPRSQIALAFAISLFLYGFSGPFLAALLDRVGLKKVMLLSMSVLLSGQLLTFVMTQVWQLMIVWGVIIGLGSSLFLTVVSPYVANHWFEKKRGLAVGILTASTATGQLILLPILATIIDSSSWRSAMLLMVSLSALMLVVLIIGMRNKPQDIGLLAYGQQQPQPPVAASQKNPIVEAFETLGNAVKAKEFWLLAASFFICGLSTSGLIGTHFVSYCLAFGIPVVTAASLLSFMGAFNLVGTTLSGWLTDRFDSRWLLFWYYLFRGVSLMMLPFALMSGNFVYLMIFTVFYGLDWIATVPPTIAIVRQKFGIQQSGIIYGWVFAAHQVGAAVAAYGGGVVEQLFNTYTWAFVMAGVFCLLASLFVMLLKKEKTAVEVVIANA